MRLPPTYMPRLRRYDRDLRVTWSNRRARFLLERRASYARVTIDPDLYGREEHDTVRQLRDGFFELGSYAPHELPPVDRLIAYLKTQDVWQRGDQDFDRLANGIADELDQDYARREAAAEQKHREEVGERAAELWEQNKWRHGERVSVPRALPIR